MDDEHLIAAFLEERDPTLFRELVERHQTRVFRLVAAILGPFSDLGAEDVTQEVFLRVHDRLGQFRGSARFSTWLHRIAWNEAIDFRSTARFRMPHVAIDVLVPTAAPAGLDLDERQRRERIAAAMESLPDLYRTVLYLYYWDEASVEEIAELIGAPQGTVRSYLHRGRERVGKLLEREEMR
jgi:RNA polymerase sigma-70 factor, ECF subfamily